MFSCGHYFCDSCAAVQLSQPNPTCAYCRGRVTKTGVFRVSLAGSGGHEPEVDPPEGQAVTHIKVITEDDVHVWAAAWLHVTVVLVTLQ